MSAKSAIEWTDATWTPIRARVREDAREIAEAKGYTSLLPIIQPGRVGPHCEHVSPGCENCYSETNNGRCLPHNGTGLPFDRRARDLVQIHVDEKILAQPLHWRKPHKIFVCSQTDLYGEFVPFEHILRVREVMLECKQHTFQILTKRPERMLDFERYLSDLHSDIIYPKHVWFGVSVENQPMADRITKLLGMRTLGKLFVSYEPALGPVDLRPWLHCLHCGYSKRDAGEQMDHRLCRESFPPTIDWVIVGGESGRNARPAHPQWFRDVRDQCQAAGVPFFFKQWGEWSPVPLENVSGAWQARMVRAGDACLNPDGNYHIFDGQISVPNEGSGCPMRRVGKKAAGALLYGREWREFPA